jgi:hypothetical protein
MADNCVAHKEKGSLNMNHDLVSEVGRRVENRELSASLNERLECRLQADAIEHYLREADMRLGPLPPDLEVPIDDAYARRFDHRRRSGPR